MKQDIKKKWVDALRSGKYHQCKGKLIKDDKHCCLGVLCEVLELPKHNGCYIYKNMTFCGLISYELTQELELYNQTILSMMNDIQNNSFNEIADYIEANI